jgi:hypothetical protein
VLWKLSNLVHYGLPGESEIVMEKDIICYDGYREQYQVRGGQIYWADAYYIRKQIADATYDKTDVNTIKRDSEIARLLGLLDIKDRLDKSLSKILNTL